MNCKPKSIISSHAHAPSQRCFPFQHSYSPEEQASAQKNVTDQLSRDSPGTEGTIYLPPSFLLFSFLFWSGCPHLLALNLFLPKETQKAITTDASYLQIWHKLE